MGVDMEQAMKDWRALCSEFTFCTSCKHVTSDEFGYHCPVHDARLSVMSTACDKYVAAEQPTSEEA